MKRKWIILTAIVSLLLFACAVWLALAVSEDPSAGETEEGGVMITEVMSGNTLYPITQGRYTDFIELHNPTDHPVDISNYKLSDREDTIGYTFPQGTVLEPGAYLVCPCEPELDELYCCNFRISGDGEIIYLYNSANVCVQRLDVPAMRKDTVYRISDSWEIAYKATPGFANTEEGYEAWLVSVGILPLQITFSEVQTQNRSFVTDSRGRLCDWVELHNLADQPAVLDGCYLSNDPQDPLKWQISALTIEPKGYAVICCTGEEGVAAEAPFGLSKNGVSLTLTGPAGNPITEIECPALKADTAWQRQADGAYCITEAVSPGYANTEEGAEAYWQQKGIPGALAIWEIMPANDRYLIQSDGESYDWVELKNISDSPIDLSDYALSDEGDKPFLFQLPAQVLEPGELVVVVLSGNTELTGRYIHAPFSLNREESWLYVTEKTGFFSDSVHIRQVPLLGSAGRQDGDHRLVYFAVPTPGSENRDGKTSIANDPFVQTPGGIYNDVQQVSVVLSGEGEIRYTLDGSLPTANSRLYTEPILLTKTATVRAKSFCQGKIPSNTVTAGYIINENHTLPVVSISADPDAMFGYGGIYTQYRQDWEIPCNLALYEPSGSFSVDCGIKMFGHTGLELPKKSFKVNFRGCYGADLLTYPVYGDEGPEVYDSLVIRSGQDYPQAIFRDELFTSLCRQMSDNVLVQRDKFCILYINGQYRGIYCIKEAFGEMFYAQNRNVSAESVEVVQAPVYVNTDVYRFMSYLGTHNMSDPDNYAYACTVFNMESLIDWMIIQGYSTNGDVQQNLRYFRSTDNGNTYEMAFYDLDWAFYYHLPFTDVLSSDRESWQHLRITQRLIRNPEFRQRFLERLSYHMEHTLSNENVLATIDYYQQLLEPEVARERARWGGTVGGWNWQVNRLRNFITNRDHLGDIVWRLSRYIGLTQTEIDSYFGRWV